VLLETILDLPVIYHHDGGKKYSNTKTEREERLQREAASPASTLILLNDGAVEDNFSRWMVASAE
jgi:hypothetical protein